MLTDFGVCPQVELLLGTVVDDKCRMMREVAERLLYGEIPVLTDFGVRLRVELSWYVGYCERDLVLAKARRFFWRLNIGALQAGFGACFRSS